jgi:hypothetical protein
MKKVINRFLFVLLGAVITFGLVSIQKNCIIKRLEKDNAKIEAENIQIEKDRKAIEIEFEKLKNKPPEVKIETKVKYIEVNKKTYLSKEDHEAVIKEVTNKKEAEKQEVIKLFNLYIADTKKKDNNYEAEIGNLKNIIANSKSSRFGFGFQLNYGYAPELNRITYSIGFGIQYKFTIKDILNLLKKK